MGKIKCVVTKIDWDTDGEVIDDLPKKITMKLEEDPDFGDVTSEDVANELSDRYGFCVNSFDVHFFNENGQELDERGELLIN